MYQEFSDAQLADLEVFLKTDQFKKLQQLSPWQRAYAVVQHLGQAKTEIGFYLLLNAFWYESDAFFQNPTSIDQFSVEVKSELSRTSDEDKPFLAATFGYALAVAGRHSEANEALDRAIGAP
jgi:hypothetical protein